MGQPALDVVPVSSTRPRVIPAVSAVRIEARRVASQIVTEGCLVVPPADLARHLGVSRQLVHLWTLEGGTTTITFADVLAAPRGFRDRALRLAATWGAGAPSSLDNALSVEILDMIADSIEVLQVVERCRPELLALGRLDELIEQLSRVADRCVTLLEWLKAVRARRKAGGK